MAILCPVEIRSGAAATAALSVVDDILSGGAAVLPVPADDPHQSAALATALRAGDEIDDAVAAVLSTSGTTGTPKGAQLTSSALHASATATHTRLGGGGRWLLALPAYHVAGFQVLVRSVIAGTEPVTLHPAFDPAELPGAVAALGSGRRYASLVAAQLDKALRDHRAAEALADLDAVLIGGGPMPATVGERAAAAGVRVIRTYGMSETAGGCVYDGIALPGVRVRVDPQARIWLGGPTVAAGYRNPVTPDPFAEPGWFRTDDVGAVDAAGVLTVAGRADDAISTGGLTVLPGLVETAVLSHPAVAECAVFGVKDELRTQVPIGLLVLKSGVETDPDTILSEVVALVREKVGPVANFKQVAITKRLPKTRSGKILRSALRKLADGVDFPVPSTIDDPAILEEIRIDLRGLGYAQN